MSERQALLNVVERIDAKAIKKAQIAALKALRAAAKERRDELQALNDQITEELNAAVDASDTAVAQQFKDRRENRIDAGVLATAIAQHDANQLVTV